MKTKISLEELLHKHQKMSYLEQYNWILHEIEEGRLKPVKSSARNGRRPALYTWYWQMEAEPDYTREKQELLYDTVPDIRIDYYIRHLSVYAYEREDVRELNAFLKEQKDELQEPVSLNERSFMIFHREKYLMQGGRTVLKHCGIDLSALHCVKTAEPFSYYADHRKTPQNILILENKDPFCGMREVMLEGKKELFGVPIGTLIYGSGKKVIASLRDFETSAEPYMKDERNTFWYYGDLDYEGIIIYQNLKEMFSCEQHRTVHLFLPAYRKMLAKAAHTSLPETKEKQNRNIDETFFDVFSETEQKQMKEILAGDRYIPQEILNRKDY
jgi:hypothetical protein